ncbi:MAG TPA: hypothetical protein VFW78_04220, partial [Bacteroidia bacterium]|nr:hypothetical protein [Bacteroidia bacterium]
MKRFLLFNLFILLSVCGTFRQASAWHLMGGELTYVYDGSTTGGDFYIVTLNVYRYCDSTALPPTPLDPNMFLGIYPGDSANPTSPLNWYETEALTLIHSDFISYIPNNPLCSFTSSVCIERGEYTATLLLPTNPGGFHLIVERCCRNNNIVNISNPGGAGMSFYAYIPPGIENSTPQITDVSVPYVCTSDTISLINNGYDPDGDSLVYSFATPFNGNSNSGNPSPDPLTNNNPYTLPISDVTFAPGYSISSIFGAGGYASIDPLTGLTRYFVPNQGFYVVAIEIREYRNGVFISSMRRDLQFIAIACPQNNTPQFDIAATPSTTFSVGEGQLLCFNATFNDPDGDSLYLSASGPLLNGAIVNPPGTMSNQSGSGTVTGQFCWTPTCGMSRSAPYQFSVTVTDNGCPQKSTSQIFSVYVTAGPASLYPTVAVAQNPPGPLCQGSITSFIANTTHAGNHPHFYWQV